jgi:hypothetical protein
MENHPKFGSWTHIVVHFFGFLARHDGAADCIL